MQRVRANSKYLVVKDNIKDKMRSIPIELSAEIVGPKRQKSKNGLPHLMPVLDPSLTSKAITEVKQLLVPQI